MSVKHQSRIVSNERRNVIRYSEISVVQSLAMTMEILRNLFPSSVMRRDMTHQTARRILNTRIVKSSSPDVSLIILKLIESLVTLTYQYTTHIFTIIDLKKIVQEVPCVFLFTKQFMVSTKLAKSRPPWLPVAMTHIFHTIGTSTLSMISKIF